MVHVGTASADNVSNPNPMESKSISAEEELPGHFWAGKGPLSYCQALDLSVSQGVIQALQLSPNCHCTGPFFELKFFTIKSGV